ncbi:hypothetical protein [Streptomyces mirabilis]|uniref:hypothetical protein n=1 Tax=Streptomyces mirabilis TaxID=68239 RepID=UPI0036659332
MPLSISGRPGSPTMTGLALVAVLCLGGCGEQRATDSTAGAPTGTSRSAAAGASGASPYVEPGAGDGAPHYNENNGYRRPGDMSPASATDATREADRIRPVLKRLWERKKWDPATVRAALLDLGYEEERTGSNGKPNGGTLTVRAMNSRFTDGREVTPEGASVGLRVHADACVTAFVQKSNYEVTTNGPYPETGCFEPPSGH